MVVTPSATISSTATSAKTSTVATQVAAGKAERTITLTLDPPAGVTVSVDNDNERKVRTGDTLTLNDREHTLRFGCEDNACDPASHTVRAGKGDEELPITLKVRDATIIVDADPNAVLGIEEYPALVVKAGQPIPVRVPVYRYVWLVDRSNPTHAKKKVDLRPGQPSKVDFRL